jgi:hypothetical protein
LWLGICIALGLAAPVAWGQQASVQGIVSDQITTQPLTGAHVVLEQGGHEVRSVLTDRSGVFQIVGLTAGGYRLRIGLLGYSTHEETISLGPGQRLTASRGLAPDPLQIEGIGVAFQGPGAVRRELGGQTITARDIGRIPTPSAAGDLASFLQTMPGVVGSGDRGGQLFIRGGTPSENLALMDGMLVYQPFHITGFFSVFPEHLVERAEFLPGGFGPKYNGRISSVLDVEMRDGSRYEPVLAASVSPFLADVHVEGPIDRERDHHSYIVSLRRSLIEETSPWLLGEEQPLRFSSFYVKLSSFDPDGGKRCSVTAMRSSDWGGLDPQDEQSRVRWSNSLVGWRCIALAGPLFVNVRFGRSGVSSEAITRGLSEFSSSASRVFMDADASRSLGRVRLNFGTFMRAEFTEFDFLEILTAAQGGREEWMEVGAYAEADVPLGGGLRVLPGLTTSWPFSGGFEPRVRASWRPTGLVDAELSGSLGLYEQQIAGISDRRDASSVFTAWVRTPADSRMRAVHAQASWQQSLGAGFSYSIDGYSRRMSNLPVTTWSTIARFTPELSLADGRTRGADGRIEFRRGPFYAFGGYGYSWTEYESAQDDFGIWFGEPVQSYHPPHDRRHQANALSSLRLGPYTLAARWEFGSGFPFTRPMGFDELFDYRTDSMILPSVAGTYGETRLLLDRPYNARLPAAHRLDISLERLVDVRSREIQLQAGLINAYNRTNMFYYDVFTGRRMDQMPFAPYASVRLQPRSGTAR